MLSSDKVIPMTTVAYLGPAGTFTEEALWRFADSGCFPDEVTPLPVNSSAEALDAVRAGDADYACVAIENSVDGAVTLTFDSLAEDGVQIYRETDIEVAFSIMVRPGTPCFLFFNRLAPCRLSSLGLIIERMRFFAEWRPSRAYGIRKFELCEQNEGKSGTGQMKEKKRLTVEETRRLSKDSAFSLLGVVSRLVRKKDRNDNPFWDISVMDGTGQIDGKIWGNSEWWRLRGEERTRLDPLADDEVLNLEGCTAGLQGKVVEFRDQNQYNFNVVYLVDQDKYPAHGFVRRSPFSDEAMEAEFRSLVEGCARRIFFRSARFSSRRKRLTFIRHVRQL